MNKHLPLTHQLFRGAKAFTLCEVTCEDSDETVRLYERKGSTPVDPLTCFFTLYGHWPDEQGPTLALLDGSEAGMKAQAFTLFEQGALVEFIDRNGLRLTLQDSCSRHLVHAVETHGEEQLSQFVLLSLPREVDAEDAAEVLASNWWKGFTDHEQLSRYVRQDGSASVEIDSVYSISEETFQELKGKISCYDLDDFEGFDPAALSPERTFCVYCGGNDMTPQGHCMDCTRPTSTLTERNALIAVVTHLVGQGWAVVGVNDGEEKISAKGKTVEQVVDDADGVDEARISFTDGQSKGTILLVWGNSPIELIADHTTANGFGAAVDAAQLSVWPNYPEE